MTENQTTLAMMPTLISRRSLVSNAFLVWAAGSLPNARMSLAAAPLAGPIVPSPLSTITDPEFARIARRAQALLLQLYQGLNYFGLPRDYVVLLDIEEYMNSIQAILQLGSRIQDTLLRYRQQDTFVHNSEAALNDALQRASELRQSQTEQLLTVRNQKTATQDIISQLRGEIDIAQGELTAAQAQFQGAVQRATSPQCNIVSVIQIVGAIVAVATGVGTLAAAAAAAVSAVANHGLALTNLPNTVRAFETVSKDVADIASKFGKIAPARAAQPDGGLLVMQEQDVDKFMSDLDKEIENSPAKGTTEAANFRDTAHRFVGLVKTRNQKILDRDGMIVAEAQLEGQLRNRDSEIAELKRQLVDVTVRDHSSYTVLVNGIFQSHLSAVRTAIWQEIRALELFTLSDLSHSYNLGIGLDNPAAFEDRPDHTLNELTDTQMKIQSDYLLKQADLPGDAQDLKPQAVEIRLSPNQRNALSIPTASGTYQISFPITLESFPKPLAEVFASQVDVQLLDDSGNRVFFDGRIIHCGRSTFRKTNGELIIFSHLPRITGIQSSSQDPVSLGFKQAKYVGVSPFTVWTLKIDQTVNDADLRSVSRIKMVFQGKFRALAI